MATTTDSAVVALPTQDGGFVSARIALEREGGKILMTVDTKRDGQEEWVHPPDLPHRRLLHDQRPEGPGLHMLFAGGWVTLQDVLITEHPNGAVHLAYSRDRVGPEPFDDEEITLTLCGRRVRQRFALLNGASFNYGHGCHQCIDVAKAKEL